MSEVPEAKTKATSYENFVAECPWCSRDSIFNRASDLGTFDPIAGLDVSCLQPDCGKPLRITGDSVNSAHETLVFDCHDLLERKRYMNCILTLAQAYEVFFGLSLRVELLFRPFAADPSHDMDALNRHAALLGDRVKKLTFVPMRALFLRGILAPKRLASLRAAEMLIKALPEKPKEPSLADLERIPDARLRELTKAVKRTTIHELRNRVVHKRAYRPTRQEAESALREARAILFPLTSRLKLYDDLNWYLTKP